MSRRPCPSNDEMNSVSPSPRAKRDLVEKLTVRIGFPRKQRLTECSPVYEGSVCEDMVAVERVDSIDYTSNRFS